MTDSIFAGQWIARVEGRPGDLAMRLTFKNGQVFESALPVGAYGDGDGELVATIRQVRAADRVADAQRARRL